MRTICIREKWQLYTGAEGPHSWTCHSTTFVVDCMKRALWDASNDTSTTLFFGTGLFIRRFQRHLKTNLLFRPVFIMLLSFQKCYNCILEKVTIVYWVLDGPPSTPADTCHILIFAVDALKRAFEMLPTKPQHLFRPVFIMLWAFKQCYNCIIWTSDNLYTGCLTDHTPSWTCHSIWSCSWLAMKRAFERSTTPQNHLVVDRYSSCCCLSEMLPICILKRTIFYTGCLTGPHRMNMA
jgi:hypothetical protein